MRRKPMSALGQKQTSEYVCAMSALPPKADIHWGDWDVRFVPQGSAPGLQYALPRADTGQSVSTLPLRMPTYQSCTLQVGSQCPGTSRSFSLIFSTPFGSSITPCSSEHLTYFTSSRP